MNFNIKLRILFQSFAMLFDCFDHHAVTPSKPKQWYVQYIKNQPDTSAQEFEIFIHQM